MTFSLTTGHFSIRILPQVSVQHSVADLVADFIWKTRFTHITLWISVCVSLCDLLLIVTFLIWAEPEISDQVSSSPLLYTSFLFRAAAL